MKKLPNIPASEITPEAVYVNRRQFMQGVVNASVVTAASLMLPSSALLLSTPASAEVDAFPDLKKSELSTTSEAPNSFKDITSYNNFYELGTSKSDPARYAEELKARPWTISIEGECEKPETIDIDALLKRYPVEERIYRLRCVEGWSMVIPWVGFSLSELLKNHQPTSKAKFVQFETLKRPEQLRGQKTDILDWPYLEGLRIDEAMHPLTILAVGLYGKILPNQNGAPIRLVVPWKYGFKSIKSIVKIRLVEKQPDTTWSLAAPNEYGFYANVNPDVPHPRWSQARERRIGELFKRATLPFNGYAEQVASLYKGMDLSHYF